jgi:peptidoglycan-associated lipoprotein
MKNVVLLTVILGAAACGGNETKPPRASNDVQTTSAPKPQAAPTAKTDQVVRLSKDIRDACKIDDANRAPKFDFDSTQLASADRDVLAQVATCLTTGALRGRSIALVGRADPRGETEYNLTLGESRATSVRKYLAGLGVDAAKMSETSRGELDATGKDEEGWHKDRRVDIALR